MSDVDLKNVGLKVTVPRLKILHILETETARHLSAEDLYQILSQQGHEINLATIYRVLTQFEAAGLIIRHNFEGSHSVFELDNGEHHDHLVCVKCSRVIEFCDEIIEQRQDEIAKKNNFKMTDHNLYIYGICENCSCQN